MPAETKAERRLRRHVSRNKDAKRERENTSMDSQMLELVRRSLLYRKSATACRGVARGELSQRAGVHLAPLASLTRAAHARYCIKLARVKIHIRGAFKKIMRMFLRKMRNI